MEYQIDENSNVLAFELNKTSLFRKRKAEKHEDDPRNQTARIILHKLSTQQANGTLASNYDLLSNEIDATKWGDIHSSVLGDIGFGYQPAHIDEVLTRIIDKVVEDRPSLRQILN
jgi:hypothetical protein